jgi:hypothetical protein
MHALVRSPLTAGIATAAASAVVVTSAALPTAPQSPPTVRAEVNLSAVIDPPPGALLEQAFVNQIENCSLICPFIVQGAIEVPVAFALIPLTFAQQLQAGEPLLQAIALTDATVSGAANDALTSIITNDLGLVLPRAQNATEVAVVQLIEVGITAVTQPGNFLQAVHTARTELLAALNEPPGTMPPPPVHNALEAAAVRAVEVTSALTFQAPERLLLGVTQAADAFFRTLGNTGDVGAALSAVGASVSTTASDSVAFIRHALTVPIPITPRTTAKATTTAPTTTAPARSLQARTPVGRQLVRPSVKADGNAGTAHAGKRPLSVLRQVVRPSVKADPLAAGRQFVRSSVKGDRTAFSAHPTSVRSTAKPVGLVRKADQTIRRAVSALGDNGRRGPKNSEH